MIDETQLRVELEAAMQAWMSKHQQVKHCPAHGDCALFELA
jgi:hypothetical protein